MQLLGVWLKLKALFGCTKSASTNTCIVTCHSQIKRTIIIIVTQLLAEVNIACVPPPQRDARENRDSM